MALRLATEGSIEITIAFTLDKGSNTERQQLISLRTKAKRQQMPDGSYTSTTLNI